MTAVEWLEQQIKDTYDREGKLPLAYTLDLVRQAKEMDKNNLKQEFIAGYNVGYTDAQCNHINDADNMAQEREYIRESTCEYSGLPSVQSYEDPKK